MTFIIFNNLTIHNFHNHGFPSVIGDICKGCYFEISHSLFQNITSDTKLFILGGSGNIISMIKYRHCFKRQSL